MLTKKQAKELAQIAWDTGTYLHGDGCYYIELPNNNCVVTWKISNQGTVGKLQILQGI